jgi:hypothetical protein
MPDKNASRRRSKGETAKRFSGFDPASGEPGQRRDGRRDKRMGRSGPERCSPEVEKIKSRAQRSKGDYEE